MRNEQPVRAYSSHVPVFKNLLITWQASCLFRSLFCRALPLLSALLATIWKAWKRLPTSEHSNLAFIPRTTFWGEPLIGPLPVPLPRSECSWLGNARSNWWKFAFQERMKQKKKRMSWIEKKEIERNMKLTRQQKHCASAQLCMLIRSPQSPLKFPRSAEWCQYHEICFGPSLWSSIPLFKNAESFALFMSKRRVTHQHSSGHLWWKSQQYYTCCRRENMALTMWSYAVLSVIRFYKVSRTSYAFVY